jgi:hypothetical protein
MKTSLASVGMGRSICRPKPRYHVTVCGLFTLAVIFSAVSLKECLHSTEWCIAATAMWIIASFARLRPRKRMEQVVTQNDYAHFCAGATTLFLILTIISLFRQ